MTLLCIDDDPDDIELFQEAMKVIDHTSVCVSAMNGREGLFILNNVLPDCIFLDLNMPGMNGMETLRHIRKDKRFQRIPVYILSTSNNRYELEICKTLGATNWLVKPDSFPELISEIRAVIQKIAIV